MPEAVIVATARSPIGRAFKGSLTEIRGDDLTAQITIAALAQIPELDPATIEDFLLGCGLPGGEQGANLGRIVPLLMGYDDIPGTTVNRFCASSLQTTRMAMHAIRAGEANVLISAGVEMVSRIRDGNPDDPQYGNSAFTSGTPQPGDWVDPRITGDMPNAFVDMGTTAENIAGIRGVSRREMDEYAFRSQALTEQARLSGFWDLDITPITLPNGTVVSRDDGPRPGTTMEKLAGLEPVFREGGSVTAGNCCGLNDGAAALVIMSAQRAKELNLTPLARIVSTAVSALSPEIMGLGPVEASKKALVLAGLGAQDLDLVEINEAFAAQVVPSYLELGIPLEKVNVNGGAIAIGHPYGMTGARITTTLIHSLQWHDKQFGLETMCVAGGQGMAMVIERLS
ncbi:acetyl-CoA C-acetyltransferase [Cryobacterium sp. M91]|uniref:acetyl-CoA C-acetyltransferase n=1 Tax=Cryobacterium sp. M91 TaxID=2048294 RepID=UPI000CE3AA25|nr:acetyl-CoA C-acetyltransferase [Cryobacterium sp. M91]